MLRMSSGSIAAGALLQPDAPYLATLEELSGIDGLPPPSPLHYWAQVFAADASPYPA
jgi:hypothetical protein